ncbi:MAG: glycoside hydrolase family 3 C-terminal domain-containing protein [Acidobacteriota bacterium]|nr:glycoside hydrolase family 3 C-terminal domain-containing protein [Acidobacteriota bacterium]
MTVRIVFLILCLFSSNTFAQKTNSQKISQDSSVSKIPSSDELLKHLSAAESHQISGDLVNAAIENRAVLGIALERFGNIAIEEGKYTDAVKYIAESLKFADTAPNRTLLAIAYLRQNLFDKALTEAQTAVSINPAHIGSHYILGNIYYNKEDYQSALPELEKVFEAAPDFEIARALGLTYLNLKQIERARIHFEKMQTSAGKENADLNILFAKFFERTNYPDDAERELRKALAIDPNKPKINFYLGYLLLQNGGSERLAEAGSAFEKELRINPKDFYSLFFSGVVYSSQNDHQKAISYLKVGGNNFKFVQGTEIIAEPGKPTNTTPTNMDREVNIKAAVDAAKNADVVVLCLGEGSYTETPGNITDLTLPETQVKFAEAIIATGKPVIAVMVEGRPRIINQIADRLPGILLAMNPGNEGGLAVADVLFGDYNPNGKLNFTYPRTPNSHLNYNHKVFEVEETEFGNLAFKPQFPFGHGMSYTSFQYSDLKLNKENISMNDEITASVTVKNTGRRAGKETVIVYVRDEVATLSPDGKRVRRFAKIRLEPGESKTLSFTMNKDDLSFIGMDNKPLVEAGEFTVMIGEMSKKFMLK